MNQIYRIPIHAISLIAPRFASAITQHLGHVPMGAGDAPQNPSSV